MKCMNILSVFASLLFYSAGYTAQNDNEACASAHDKGFYTFEHTSTRFNQPDVCFRREHDVIMTRRQSNSSRQSSGTALEGTVGIGLSGGGIKSSAFQLGLLSGLHGWKTVADGSKSLLGEVDYLSSVSGGSWANGAYWSAKESDDIFFECLNKLVSGEALDDTCRSFDDVLPNKQSDIWGSRKWQLQIINNFLRGQDKKITDIASNPDGPLTRRPYPIFLATHTNTIIGKKSIKNFPFEITPLNLGTIADCKSRETPCGLLRRYLRPLHWNNAPEQGFMVDLENVQDIDIVVKKYSNHSRQHGLRISHAMWSSGALVAKVFSLHLRLSRDGEKLDGVRRKYVLSDGGKTDNIGLIPLVERGTGLIILSQIAGDPDTKFGDLQRSSEQVKRLFDVDVDTERLTSPHRSDEEVKPIITHSCVSKGPSTIASVLLIKPTRHNISSFYSYLGNSKKYKYLLDDLTANETGKDTNMAFPQNDTIEFRYRKTLIYAYYLLGKYIAEERLAPLFENWLSNGDECS